MLWHLSQTDESPARSKNDLLVMVIADPWESCYGGKEENEIGDDADDHDGVSLDLLVLEVEDDLEEDPYDTGSSASTVDTTQMLG